MSNEGRSKISGGAIQIKSVNSCQRKFNEPTFVLLFSTHILNLRVLRYCRRPSSKFSNHPHASELSNLFGSQRFQTLVCTLPQQSGKQEVNDSDTQIDRPKQVEERLPAMANTIHLIEGTKLSSNVFCLLLRHFILPHSWHLLQNILQFSPVHRIGWIC